MNIALIGLGMVADTHVAAIRASAQNLNLSCVLGRDAGRTRAFADKTGTRVADATKDIAQDTSIDFAIVATPPNARIEIVRARAASIALKQAIDAGVLGDLATVELRIPWWRNQSYYDAPGRGSFGRDGGGVMISQAIHTLDLAMWLVGPIATIQALMRTTPLHHLEAEDWAGALFEFENGVCGSLMASTAAFPGQAESIVIQGSKAAAHLAFGVLTLHHLDGRTEELGANASTGGGADPMAFTHAWHQSVIEDFARDPSDQVAIDTALAEVPDQPIGCVGFFAEMAKAIAGLPSDTIHFADGTRSVELVTAIYHSARGGGRVKLPIPPDHPLFEGWLP
ncbi:Gfo/Idh/MocA family oxidoreductase [Pseudosulfitobacter sp. SM2401]|uniref:Gfo/Idh/MocA family protein n=1 Tax=Pseudosulfitobacter sp. SM2401 TaxID=3350098 RepID=UPI0036F1BC99